MPGPIFPGWGQQDPEGEEITDEDEMADEGEGGEVGAGGEGEDIPTPVGTGVPGSDIPGVPDTPMPGNPTAISNSIWDTSEPIQEWSAERWTGVMRHATPGDARMLRFEWNRLYPGVPYPGEG